MHSLEDSFTDENEWDSQTQSFFFEIREKNAI